MARLRPHRLAMPIVFGMLLASGGAWAQTQNPPLGGESDSTPTSNANAAAAPELRDAQRFRKLTIGDPPVFQVPKYGNPPAAGAGVTGFNSVNNRKKKKPPPAIATQPLPIIVKPPDATLAPVYRQPLTPAQVNRLYGQTPYAATPLDQPLLRPVRRRAEEDPFGALGWRAGAFILKPSIDITAGYDDNPGRIPNGPGSAFQQVAPELSVKSDWSRHEIGLNLKGSYVWYTQQPQLNRPNFEAKATARLDVSSQTRADLEGRYQYATDSPGNPNNPTDVSKPPVYQVYGATAGLTQKFNRFEVTAKGSADRTVYDNATLNDGTILNLDERSFTQYGASLRGSYEVSPGIKPFVEGSGDRRIHDFCPVCTGRDSDGRAIRVGSTFELTRKLTGEASVGYLTRRYDEAALPNLSGFIADASLIWAATPLTNATLTAKSTVDESTMTGVSGILKRDVGLQVDHAFRHWLVGTAKAGYGLDVYQGIGREDQRFSASAALTYKASRAIQFKGEFRQEWLTSSVGGQDYTASIVTFGLRLQQ